MAVKGLRREPTPPPPPPPPPQKKGTKGLTLGPSNCRAFAASRSGLDEVNPAAVVMISLADVGVEERDVVFALAAPTQRWHGASHVRIALVAQ